MPENRSSSTTLKPLAINQELIDSFKPARVFKQHIETNRQYSSLSFDDHGELLVTTGEDEKLQLFSCRSGKHKKELASFKYGAHLVRFTHKSQSVLYGSTKENDTIRYLSLYDNTYIKYFTGHKDKVVSIEVSPTDDTFLSAAMDDTVRLWDTRTSNAQGVLNISGYPTVSYDQTGMVFSVILTTKNTILLYDLRNFEKEPFLTKTLYDPTLEKLPPPPGYATFPQPFPTSARFSNNGKHILIGAAGSTHYVLDAFEAEIVGRLHGHLGLENVDRTSEGFFGASVDEVCWTPDGHYVLGGSADGKLNFWDIHSKLNDQSVPPAQVPDLYPCRTIDAHNKDGGPSRIVGFNPRSAMFVSGGNDLAFWLPEKEKSDQEGDVNTTTEPEQSTTSNPTSSSTTIAQS